MSVVTQITASGETRDIADSRIGDLSSLQTSEKTSIVSAINEIASGAGGDDLFRPLSIPFSLTAQNNGLTAFPDQLKMYKNKGNLFVSAYVEDNASNAPGTQAYTSMSHEASAEVYDWAVENFGEAITSPASSYGINVSQSFVMSENAPGVEGYSVVTTALIISVLGSGVASFTVNVFRESFVALSQGTHYSFSLGASLTVPLLTSAS